MKTANRYVLTEKNLTTFTLSLLKATNLEEQKKYINAKTAQTVILKINAANARVTEKSD